MPKGKMLVYTDSISPERDAEFNTWYDRVHVPDVLKIDGIIGCTRFKVAESPAADTPGKYLAIYDVEADDFNDILDALVTAFTDGSLPTNDCLVRGTSNFRQPRPDGVRRRIPAAVGRARHVTFVGVAADRRGDTASGAYYVGE
jgi:hypothetical protein